MSGKVYVEVQVRFDTEGSLTPESIIWEDGRHFQIEKVLDVRPAASLKAGGCGIRYTCRICGREKYLFMEESRWFIE